jgi:hypothetical protein
VALGVVKEGKRRGKGSRLFSNNSEGGGGGLGAAAECLGGSYEYALGL